MPACGNNATPPAPAHAPGVERIDPRAVALELGRTWADSPAGRALARQVPGFDAPFFQAGLAGYSDAAMRVIARRHGAPMCVTEALLDRMLLGGGRGFDKADLARDEDLLAENLPAGAEDHPLSGQIIGADPDEMAAAALKMIEQGARHAKAYRDLAYGQSALPAYADTRWAVRPAAGAEPGTAAHADAPGGGAGADAAAHSPASRPARTFAVIDVNLACPVKKIDRKSRGGHWLREPEGAIDILRAVRAAVPAEIPCSVKLRRGYDDTPEMAAAFTRVFEGAMNLGYAWATVHARTVEQKYVGPSRWGFLRDLVRNHPGALVFGSGDVWEVDDIFRMIAYTGVAAVSVARGCIGNPWIFRQARDRLAGLEAQAPTIAQQRDVLRQHFALSAALHGERHAGRMMRKFGIKFAQHHPRAEAVRSRMIAVSTSAQWLGVLDEFYRDGPEAADVADPASAAITG